MQFKIKPLNSSICFIYGFGKDNRVYDFVLTLETKNSKEAEVHALLSREKLTPNDFVLLWDKLREATKVEWFIFEVLPEHAKAYKVGLEVTESKKNKTFDGFDSEILRVNRKAKIRFACSKRSGDRNKAKILFRRLNNAIGSNF